MAESVIIGREEELALLEQRLGAIVDGGTSAVVLEGDPGIGKTTLFRAGVSSARERGYTVLACRPSAPEVPLAYAGLGDLLEPVGPDVLGALPPPQREALEIALRLRDVGAAPADPGTISVAFRNVLRELSAAQPLLVAVDDAQWIDSPSAAALEFAARRLELEPLLLLMTVRRDAGAEPKVDLERAQLDGRLTRVELGPLGLEQLSQLIQRRLGRSLSRPELIRLREASGGNPFYALELARAASAHDSARAGEPLELPETLRELVDRRLAALSAPVRRILEVTAAAPDPTVALVAAASGGHGDISTALEEAVAAAAIELDGDKVRAAHPLLAAGAYSRVAPPRRKGLHRKLASLVDNPEARARHLALGTDGPREDAAAVAEDAARLAAARGAPGTAAELCEQAIRLTPRSRTEARAARELALVRYHLASGDLSRARATLSTLRGELSQGPARAEVLVLLARIEPVGGPRLELLEEAQAEAAGNTKLLSLIHHLRGSEWMSRGEAHRALRDLRQALALADECGDAGAIAAAITSLVMAEPSTGHATPGLLERALSLEPAPDDPSLIYSVGSALALIRLYQGRLDEARTLSERLLADAAALGNEAGRMQGLRLLAQVDFRAGDWEVADRHAIEARELMLQIGPQPTVTYIKAVIDAHLGRVDEARKAAREWIAYCARVNSFYGRIQHTSVLGLLELGLGNADAADRLFRPLVDELVRSGWAIEVFFPSGEPIDALVAVGELEPARDLVDRFQREGGVFDSHWIAAAAERCRGLVLAAEGDLAGAQDAFESALAAQEQNGWPFERARTLLALGQMQRRAKHRRAARESLRTALAVFDELGAVLWARQTNAELARIGGRAPGSGELTPTEERVAALVAEGRTNKEAAAALYLSPHTVEGHLSRIYAKLGIRSRTELAHRLAGTAARSSDD